MMRFDKEIFQLYHQMELLLTVKDQGGQVLNPDYPELYGVLGEIRQTIASFSEPLRVAVAGYMKAGKSTLLNGIMQRKALCTGNLICTYTPTWFKYAPEESLALVFKDGTIQKGLSLSELERWTSIEYRTENPRMNDVEYLILYYPSELLKRIELIDTPGLFSPEEEDSKRTIQLLGLGGLEETQALNSLQVSKADAVIYAFSANFKENDLHALDSFTTTPINAIGVFTKLDQSYWDSMEHPEDPAQRMAPVIQRNAAELKDRLYCILPVTGIVAEGYSAMTPECWNALISIAREPEEALSAALISAARFVRTSLGSTTPQQRTELIQIFGAYGIYCAAQGIRSGLNREQLGPYLYRRSGIEALVEKLESHFGTRSFIIKTEAALGRIEAKLHKIEYDSRTSRQTRQVCSQITREIEEVRNSETFSQLELLRQFYEGGLRFPSESLNQSFLSLMGERGNSASARLGLSDDASVEVLLNRIRELHEQWSGLRNDFTLSRNTEAALEVVWNSIGELRYHIEMLAAY